MIKTQLIKLDSGFRGCVAQFVVFLGNDVASLSYATDVSRQCNDLVLKHKCPKHINVLQMKICFKNKISELYGDILENK